MGISIDHISFCCDNDELMTAGNRSLPLKLFFSLISRDLLAYTFLYYLHCLAEVVLQASFSFYQILL